MFFIKENDDILVSEKCFVLLRSVAMTAHFEKERRQIVFFTWKLNLEQHDKIPGE